MDLKQDHDNKMRQKQQEKSKSTLFFLLLDRLILEAISKVASVSVYRSSSGDTWLMIVVLHVGFPTESFNRRAILLSLWQR